MKKFAALFTFLMTAGAAMAVLYIPVAADFEIRGYQFAIESSAWNTPTIRLTPSQGAAAIDPSLYSWTYRFGPTESSTSMVTIAGAVNGTNVDFVITGADFGIPAYRWYSAFVAQSGTSVYSFARGYLTIVDSPEVTASAYVIRTSPSNAPSWVESIVSVDGSVVNQGDSVDQVLSVTNYVEQVASRIASNTTEEIASAGTNSYTKAQSDARFATTGDLADVASDLAAETSSRTGDVASLTASIASAVTIANSATTNEAAIRAAADSNLQSQVDAIDVSAGTNAYTKAESDLRYAGTNELAILSLRYSGTSNLLDTVYGWGNHATNGYAVQGGDITGRWVAAGNTSTGSNAFVGGGLGNIASALYSTVGGGRTNMAVGQYSVIGGGWGSISTGNISTVGGGLWNNALGNGSTVAGGSQNIASGSSATVGGGAQNTASGQTATVPGGEDNLASGQNSFAAGYRGKATNIGSFVWSGSQNLTAAFYSRGDFTFNARAIGGVYFLAPDFHIQDTNGNTIARFSTTGTVVRGPFQIGTNSIHYDERGNMVATDVWIHVQSATNALEPVRYDQFQPIELSYSAVTAALAVAQSTIATLTSQVASLIAQLPLVSNGYVAADSVITALVAGVDTRLVQTSNHFASTTASQDATNGWLYTQLTNGDALASLSWTGTTASLAASLTATSAWMYTQATNLDHSVTTGLQASIAANLSTFSSFTNSYAAAITNVDAKTFGGTIKAGFMLTADWEGVSSNVVFAQFGTITATNDAGSANWMKYNGTNVWLRDNVSWQTWVKYGF